MEQHTSDSGTQSTKSAFTAGDSVVREMLRQCEEKLESTPEEAEGICAHAVALARRERHNELIADALHLYGQCCWQLFRYQEALQAYDEARVLYHKLVNNERIAELLLFRGHIHHRLGRYEPALNDYKGSFDIYEELGERFGMADALIGMGLVYWMLDDYENAVDYYMQSLDLYKELGDKKGEADCRNNIGIIYRMMGSYDAALQSISESRRLFEELDSRHGLAEALGNLGVVYFEMRQYDKTLDAFSRCLDLFRQAGNKYGLAGIVNNIGMVWAKQGQHRKARDFYERGLALAREIRSGDREVEALISLGKLHTELKEYTRGLQCFKEALTITEELKLKSQTYLLHRFIAESYEAQGELAAAIEHLKLHQQVKEDVFNESSDRKLKNLQILYQVENAENTAEIYRLKNVELAGALKKLESSNRHFQELNREKNEILSIAAHDLKNPLNSIMMLARHIRSVESTLEPESLESLDDIVSTAQRMFELVRNLLNLNAIEEGKLHLSPESMDLGMPVTYIINSYRKAADAKDIGIRYTAPENSILIYADRNAAIQVVDNLVSNAVKYTRKGGTVQIQLEQDAHSVRCAVRDEGPGISEEDRKKLFGKFVRLSARPTGGEHSTGLGLSIVKRIIEAMNGRVYCESEVGKGSVFYAEFPTCEPESTSSV